MRRCASAEDSVEIALAFFKACGAYLQDVNNAGYQRWALHSCCTLPTCTCCAGRLAPLYGYLSPWPWLAGIHMLCGKLGTTVGVSLVPGQGWHGLGDPSKLHTC